MHWGPRGRRAAALRRRRQGGAQRQAGRCALGGGLVGQGRAHGVGVLQRRRRNGRVAPYAAARLTRRARGRAGRQNADNSPAHPTSLFSPQSARGVPRHVGCSALSTTSARSTALFRGFSYQNCAGRASEGSLASKPMRGDEMRVFSRVCARLPGWFPRTFLAQTRFLEVYAITFSAHVAGICPHIAGQLMSTRGTQRAQKNRAPRTGRRGMTLRGDKTRVFW